MIIIVATDVERSSPPKDETSLDGTDGENERPAWCSLANDSTLRPAAKPAQ